MYRETAHKNDEYRMWMSLGRSIKLELDFERIPRDLIHDIVCTVFDKLNIVLSEDDTMRFAAWRNEGK